MVETLSLKNRPRRRARPLPRHGLSEYDDEGESDSLGSCSCDRVKASHPHFHGQGGVSKAPVGLFGKSGFLDGEFNKHQWRMLMLKKWFSGGRLVLLVFCLALVIGAACSQSQNNPLADKIPWKVSDSNRPLPPVITAGTESTPEHAGVPPSDAIVLFDGKDLSA